MGTSFAATLLSTNDVPGEEKLWRGVLCNALEDSCNNQNDRKSSIFKLEAHNWIMNEGDDFQSICYWAGFSPEHVKSKYVQAIKKKDIKFTEKQVAWRRYYVQYQKYRKCKEPSSKKYHRKHLEHLRSAVYHASTSLFSSILISVIV
jgi:hypothetical protein|tara:strand:+ start:3616 stop:4056 length:441 start_codon:yes stop_codon:yes gene_type:complete